MNDILHYISGPVIGAAIGAFTNFLAIKMLFRPLKPVKIGRFTLPFTPGVIPRHKEKLADSLSDIVYKNFFTNSDIEGIFMSDEMADRFSDGIYKRLTELDTGMLKELVDEKNLVKIKKVLYIKIHTAILSRDISAVFEEEVRKFVENRTAGDLFSSVMLNEDMAVRIAGYAGTKVTDYLMEHDLELIWPVLNELEKEIMEMNPEEAVALIGLNDDIVKDLIKRGYLRFMKNAKSTIAEGFHMKQFIHDKIMELDPGEIEFHVNSAIKREMNYLVYLGGFLGLLIGIINIFV